jgi:hypothetical protein
MATYRRRRITHLQTSPVKNKIESVRARLDRLGVEGECREECRRAQATGKFIRVRIFRPRRTSIHIKLVSELSRGSRTSCNFYPNDPVPLSTHGEGRGHDRRMRSCRRPQGCHSRIPGQYYHEKRIPDGSLMQLIVLAAEGDLRAEL